MSVTTCVLHSGGVDSTALLQRYVNRRTHVQTLFVDYGQAAGRTELERGRLIARDFGIDAPVVVDVRSLADLLPAHPLISGRMAVGESYEKKSALEFFPNRNLLLLTAASIYCSQRGIGRVAIGILGGRSRYGDTTAGFVHLTNLLFALSTRVKVSAPLLGWTKRRAIEYLTKNRFDVSQTYSCNVRSGDACGRCASCIERDRAIASSAIDHLAG